MTKTDLLQEMRSIETHLRSIEVQKFFKSETQHTRDRFASQLNEISQQVAKLSNDQIAEIANRLDELSVEIEVGIENLQEELNKLENAITILNTISNVLSLVGRVLEVSV